MSNIQAKIDAVIDGVNDVKSEIQIFGEEKYNEGFSAGVASVGGEVPQVSDKIYSQAELDAQVLEGKAQTKAEIKAAYDASQIDDAAFAESLN